MAYPISRDVLNLFKNNSRQIVNITFYGKDRISTFTENDIMQGGLAVDRYTVSGSRIELGSAIAGELTLTLNNRDGRFDNTIFEGAEMYVRVGTKKWEAHNWEHASEHFIPLGYFTIDNSPRKLTSISLTALDRMVNFDKACEPEKLVFPMTVGTLLTLICNICNVSISTDITTLSNINYVIQAYPEGDELTYRQLLQWIAEITGTCAYIDWDGKLRLEWYGSEPVDTITSAERYSSDLGENSITITGIKIITEDEEYLAGDDSYCFSIEANSLIQNDFSSIVSTLYEKLGGFTYTPYSCTTKPMPHIYPLDCISYVDKSGNVITTIVTKTNYKANGSTVIEGSGETAASNGYATANPLTKQESAIIKTIQSIVNQQLNERVQSVLTLNETIAGALGLYTTTKKNPDGSVDYYFHTNPKLEDSINGDVIYTFVGGGFACCTTGWNGGNPIWETGFTKDGNAVFNFVSANGIEVANANTDYKVNITPEVFEIWYRAVKVITVNADESQFTKAVFKTYAEVGKTRLIPYIVGGQLAGTNLVFLD